jgi:hypothetical protein
MQIKSSLDSELFHLHSTLTPLLWDENEEVKAELLPKIQNIANEYIKFCDLPSGEKVIDVTITGSLAGFNYTKYSDLDIHIIIDYAKLGVNEEIATNYFGMKRDMWSENYDLKFFSFPIELYAQDVKQYKAGTSPQYSILKQEWVHKPEIPENGIDETTIVKKSMDIMHQVNDLEDEVYNDLEFDVQDSLDELQSLKKKIKSMRQEGIQESGEFSTGNLVFKLLRNSNYLQRITDLKKYITETSLSIN